MFSHVRSTLFLQSFHYSTSSSCVFFLENRGETFVVSCIEDGIFPYIRNNKFSSPDTVYQENEEKKHEKWQIYDAQYWLPDLSNGGRTMGTQVCITVPPTYSLWWGIGRKSLGKGMENMLTCCCKLLLLLLLASFPVSRQMFHLSLGMLLWENVMLS